MRRKESRGYDAAVLLYIARCKITKRVNGSLDLNRLMPVRRSDSVATCSTCSSSIVSDRYSLPGKV